MGGRGGAEVLKSWGRERVKTLCKSQLELGINFEFFLLKLEIGFLFQQQAEKLSSQSKAKNQTTRTVRIFKKIIFLTFFFFFEIHILIILE